MVNNPHRDPLAPLLLKLRARDDVSAEEEAVLRDAVYDVREEAADRVIVKSGTELSHSTLLIEGFICRYNDLRSGERQILELHIPGDFLDLHGFLLKSLEHNVGSLTPVRIAKVSHDRLRRITEQHPHLGRMLWFSTLLDAAIHRERILSVGRRSALARIAHLLCELNVRLAIVGLAENNSYDLPITQTDVADACGLTSVHVNRMLKELRNRGLITFRSSEVVIHDWEGLKRTAEFNDSFLFLERRPR